MCVCVCIFVTETEKYAHVTFFFNGGIEEAWPGEDRGMVPSPKVPTYDLKPEMNASGVAKEVLCPCSMEQNYFNYSIAGDPGGKEWTISFCHV